jgi:hypothetical protein
MNRFRVKEGAEERFEQRWGKDRSVAGCWMHFFAATPWWPDLDPVCSVCLQVLKHDFFCHAWMTTLWAPRF